MKKIKIMSAIIGILIMNLMCISVYAEGDAVKNLELYLNGNKISSDTAAIEYGDGVYFSLRDFFESRGATVEYDEETEDVYITHLNEVFYVETGEDLWINRQKNPTGIKWTLQGLQLWDMGGSGIYEVINNKIYLAEETFTWMLRNIGYRIENISDNTGKKFNLIAVTLDDFKNCKIGMHVWEFTDAYAIGDINIDGYTYGIYPISDGSFMAIKDNGVPDEWIIEEMMLIDPIGRKFVFQNS